MSDESEKARVKTLGQAIDAIVEALRDLDNATRASAIHASCEHLSIPLPKGPQRAGEGLGDESGPGSGAEPIADIRTLKEKKRPTTASEMAALVGFYFSEIAGESERKAEVDVGDMEKYFKQAGFRLPKVPRMILQNAKNAGYFDSTGSGQYRLNPVGYNLVAHGLPRHPLESSERKPARKARKPKGKRPRRRPRP